MPKRIDSETVVDALRLLVRTPLDRTVRVQLFDFLILKAKEPLAGAGVELRATGPFSATPELERFFKLAADALKPYVNPFGQSEGKLQWLHDGYSRSGVYTHFLPGRTMTGIAPSERMTVDGNDVLKVKLPAEAAGAIGSRMTEKVSLQAAAAFLLRDQEFDDDAEEEAVLRRFREVFHLDDADVARLFASTPDFAIRFGQSHVNAVPALPDDLRPENQPGAITTTTLVMPEAVLRRARTAIRGSRAVVFVGPPGSGKSQLVDHMIAEVVRDPTQFGLASRPSGVSRHGADADWTARTIIGGYYPTESGRLVFREGYLLSSIASNHWLVLDEMNRADLDRVLGAALTFLAGQAVELGPTEMSTDAKRISLEWSTSPRSEVVERDGERVYRAGTDWRMMGTYNDVDIGRVFSMGMALTRRLAQVPVPPIGARADASGIGFDRVLLAVASLPQEQRELITALYEHHRGPVRVGPGPFVDMAKLVAETAASGGTSDQIRTSLADAYVLYVSRLLRRLDPDASSEFFDGLRAMLGPEIVDELRA